MRAVIYGVGAVGQLIAGQLLQRGVHIVGAIGHQRNVGRDLGTVIGQAQPLGVCISSDAEQVLAAAHADIVILCVGETVAQSWPHLQRCIRHGCNVISLSEQLFYPWVCAPALSADIEALAQRHQVTVFAGGMQDVFWVNLPVVLSAACARLQSISGVSIVNGDVFGPAVAEDCLIGVAAEAFAAPSAELAARPNVFTVALHALAAELHLTVTDWSQAQQPMIATEPVASASLGRIIEPGQIKGLITSSQVRTAEGIELNGAVHLQVFSGPSADVTRWDLIGEPSVSIECPDTGGYAATGATVLNRLREVIAAPPGLISVTQLAKPKYQY